MDDATNDDASGWQARKKGRMAFFNESCCCFCCWEVDASKDDVENGRMQEYGCFWMMND